MMDLRKNTHSHDLYEIWKLDYEITKHDFYVLIWLKFFDSSIFNQILFSSLLFSSLLFISIVINTVFSRSRKHYGYQKYKKKKSWENFLQSWNCMVI